MSDIKKLHKNNGLEVSCPQGVQDVFLVMDAAQATMHSLNEIERLYSAVLTDGQNSPLHQIGFNLEDQARKIMAEQQMDYPSAMLLAHHDEASLHRQTLDAFYADNVRPADTSSAVFKMLEQPDVSELVTRALSIQYLAASYEENEKTGIKEKFVNMPMKAPDATPMGEVYVDGFKNALVAALTDAKELAQKKGFGALAGEVQDVINTIVPQDAQAAQTPQEFVRERISNERMAVSYAAQFCNVSVREDWVEKMEKYGRQTKKPEAAAPGSNPQLTM